MIVRDLSSQAPCTGRVAILGFAATLLMAGIGHDGDLQTEVEESPTSSRRSDLKPAGSTRQLTASANWIFRATRAPEDANVTSTTIPLRLGFTDNHAGALWISLLAASIFQGRLTLVNTAWSQTYRINIDQDCVRRFADTSS